MCRLAQTDKALRHDLLGSHQRMSNDHGMTCVTLHECSVLPGGPSYRGPRSLAELPLRMHPCHPIGDAPGAEGAQQPCARDSCNAHGEHDFTRSRSWCLNISIQGLRQGLEFCLNLSCAGSGWEQLTEVSIEAYYTSTLPGKRTCRSRGYLDRTRAATPQPVGPNDHS